MHGDLVMYGGHVCRFVIDSDSAYLKRLSDGNQYLPCALEEAVSIPITKDILTKNGFFYYSGDTYKLKGIAYDLNTNLVTIQNSKDFFANECRRTAQFVEDLQIVLRVFGYEELANDFKI